LACVYRGCSATGSAEDAYNARSSEVSCHTERSKGDVLFGKRRPGRFRSRQPFIQLVVKGCEHLFQVALHVSGGLLNEVLPSPIVGKTPELCVRQQLPELLRYLRVIETKLRFS